MANFSLSRKEATALREAHAHFKTLAPDASEALAAIEAVLRKYDVAAERQQAYLKEYYRL